jgi:uncharacterized protein
VIRRTIPEVFADQTLFTLLSEPDVPTGKLVIMAHGFRGNSTGPARTFVNFERALIEDGFSCLRFDQPCSGNSTGDFADSSFSLWIETIVYLATRYIRSGFRVALLGQSMGASATIAASARPELRNQVPCVLLWVPDPVVAVDDAEAGPLGEEDGQLYPLSFWTEARDARFFDCVASYRGGIHLVYGDRDRYVAPELRQQVIDAVSKRGDPVLVLPDEDHSPWRFASAQRVFEQQRAFLKRYF